MLYTTGLAAGGAAAISQVVAHLSMGRTTDTTPRAPTAGGVYNVRDYDATGNGKTDDCTAIQAALDACRLAGGGVVYLPAGVYLINSCPRHPLDDTINVSLVVGGKTTVRGDGPGATILKFGPSIPNQGHMMMNYNRLTNSDTDMALCDIEVDGNAAVMPRTIDAHYGPEWLHAHRTLFSNVVAHDFYGTGASSNGPNGTQAESWMLDVHYSSSCRFDHCTCYDSGVNKTASGFSANGSTLVTFSDCYAYNMALSHGFTHWHCSNITYSNCYSYLHQSGSGGQGFNSENSGEVLYLGCVSGGISADIDGYPFSASSTLGNAAAGWLSTNAVGRHVWIGCASINNAQAGFVLRSGSKSGRYAFDSCIIRSNSGYGIDADSTAAPYVRVGSTCDISGNATASLRYGNTRLANLTGILTPTPDIPSPDKAFKNPYPMPTQITITGGTVTAIKVGSATIATNTTSPVTFMLPPQQTVTISYSKAPDDWVWMSLFS